MQTDIYKKWLDLTEINHTDIFKAFDNLWERYGNIIHEVGENTKIFHAGTITSYENFEDQPIFGSESEVEAEDYLKFSGSNQRKICTFQTVRACRFAYLGGSFIENEFADFLWSKGAKGLFADQLRAISAREWAANKSIDGWYRDIDRGELLVFRPLQTLRLSSVQAV
ncbi:MAG: hypothetical protein ABF308_21105 [Phaeobacter gallaeciensis]